MKTFRTILISIIIALSGINQSMAQGSEFQVPEITTALQARIDKMMDKSIQQADRSLDETAVAQKKAKPANSKQAS